MEAVHSVPWDQVPPRLADVQWLAQIAGEDRIRLVVDKEPNPLRRRASPPFVASARAGWGTAKCRKDEGLVCGPAFVGGPLDHGHAHSFHDRYTWPIRYGHERDFYELVDGQYKWNEP